MLRAIIFANGEINPPYPLQSRFLPEDWIIAADGGAAHCTRLGITPHAVVGDFDSLGVDDMNTLNTSGIQIYRYSTRKDETDLELAVLFAVNKGAGQIRVYGALGGRWDMTLANLMLLTHSAFQHIQLSLVDGNQEISLLCGRHSLTIPGRKGDTVSLIPLSQEARGITTQDLEYPLQHGTIKLGSPRGVSNVMLGENCQITLEEGFLAVVHICQERT